MENKKIDLIQGALYWDKANKEMVESGYMGKTGLAIVYEPGDSGGCMQSSWGVYPENLEKLVEDKFKKLYSPHSIFYICKIMFMFSIYKIYIYHFLVTINRKL